jgi:hypothetical protein
VQDSISLKTFASVYLWYRWNCWEFAKRELGLDIARAKSQWHAMPVEERHAWREVWQEKGFKVARATHAAKGDREADGKERTASKRS